MSECMRIHAAPAFTLPVARSITHLKVVYRQLVGYRALWYDTAELLTHLHHTITINHHQSPYHDQHRMIAQDGTAAEQHTHTKGESKQHHSSQSVDEGGSGPTQALLTSCATHLIMGGRRGSKTSSTVFSCPCPPPPRPPAASALCRWA